MSKPHRPIHFLAVLAVSLSPLTACGKSEPTSKEQPAGGEASTPSSSEAIKVGLITKTETNPFFVKMKQGAQEAARAQGATLMTASGRFDGDNESQVTAIENMIAAGVKGILITPNDSKAIVPALEKARAKGVLVISLDTPTEPENAADGLFATDNFKAGEPGRTVVVDAAAVAAAGV